jgi:hypothetical protein
LLTVTSFDVGLLAPCNRWPAWKYN